MKFFNIILIAIPLLFGQCQTKIISELELRIDSLQLQIQMKDSTIGQLETKLQFSEDLVEFYKPDNSIAKLSNSEIIQLVKNDLDFYSSECKHKNFRVRKISDTNYHVSFQRQRLDVHEHFKDDWGQVIYTVELLPARKYTVDFQSGTLCV